MPNSSLGGDWAVLRGEEIIEGSRLFAEGEVVFACSPVKLKVRHRA